jgi:hypothetical protein
MKDKTGAANGAPGQMLFLGDQLVSNSPPWRSPLPQIAWPESG